MKKLPAKIYGYWHNDTGRPDDEYFRTDDDPNTFIAPGETLKVGVYELVGTATIENSTAIKPALAKRKR